MTYKVDYYTLAIIKDKRIGNINQGNGTIYTDSNIAAIPEILDNHLKFEKKVGIITNIKKVNGKCLFKK